MYIQRAGIGSERIPDVTETVGILVFGTILKYTRVSSRNKMSVKKYYSNTILINKYCKNLPRWNRNYGLFPLHRLRIEKKK